MGDSIRMTSLPHAGERGAVRRLQWNTARRPRRRFRPPWKIVSRRRAGGSRGVHPGVDARRLAVGGDSAGGNLAAVMTLFALDAGPRSRVSFSSIRHRSADEIPVIRSERGGPADETGHVLLPRPLSAARHRLARLARVTAPGREPRRSPTRVRADGGLRSAGRRGQSLRRSAGARGREDRAPGLSGHDPRVRHHGTRARHRRRRARRLRPVLASVVGRDTRMLPQERRAGIHTFASAWM